MPTTEFDGWLGAQFAREANVAQVVLCRTDILLTAWLEAGQAGCFMGDAAARMATGLVNFLAWRNLDWELRLSQHLRRLILERGDGLCQSTLLRTPFGRVVLCLLAARAHYKRANSLTVYGAGVSFIS